MKIINTKYYTIEMDDVVIDEYAEHKIEWLNVIAYAFGFAIIGMAVLNWWVL